MTTPELILEAVRSRGSDARDLRDAAHEAHHALFAQVRGSWDREAIHTALVRHSDRSGLGMGALISYELDARAVERTVCLRLGVDHDLDKWSHITWMETLKNMRVTLPHMGWVGAGIETRMDRKLIQTAADAVMNLTPKRKRKTK